MKVILKDGSQMEVEKGISVLDLAKKISEGLARMATCAKVNGEVKDLRFEINEDSEVEILTEEPAVNLDGELLAVENTSDAELETAADDTLLQTDNSVLTEDADNKTAIHLVESNCAVMMNIATSNGTLKNIPAIPQIIPQNTRFINIANVDRFSVLPANFGSSMLPNITCSAISPTAVKIGCCNDGAVISEYSIGKAHATIAPIVGI